MSATPEPKPTIVQFPLWALMATPVAAAVLLGLGKLLGTLRSTLDLAQTAPGTLPTEWALVLEILVVALMVAFAARLGVLRPLLRSCESPIWFGGILLFTAGFFRWTYGPWMSDLSHYSFITWNLSLAGLPNLLIFGQMTYGAVVAGMCYATIVSGRGSSYRWRWIVVGLFLAMAAGSQFAQIYQAGAWIDHVRWTAYLCVKGMVLASLAITVGCAGRPPESPSDGPDRGALAA